MVMQLIKVRYTSMRDPGSYVACCSDQSLFRLSCLLVTGHSYTLVSLINCVLGHYTIDCYCYKPREALGNAESTLHACQQLKLANFGLL